MLFIYFYSGMVAEWFVLIERSDGGRFIAFPKHSRDAAIRSANGHRSDGWNAKAVSVKMLTKTAKGMTTYGQFLR